MEHHPKFEHSRFIGDKRTQFVYDLDSWDDPAIIDEIVAAGCRAELRARHARRGPQPGLHPCHRRRPSSPPQATRLRS